MPATTAPALPPDAATLVEALAEFVAASLMAQQSVLVIVPDDELLPSVSNALDMALRPLCLVLPRPGFAARIALRATLSLLKSRLARGGEASHAVVWQAQRERLEGHAETWSAALTWCSGNNEQVPEVRSLFPACILPATQAEVAASSRCDIVVVVLPEQIADTPALLSLGTESLLLSGQSGGYSAGRALALSDAEAQLLAEQEVLAQQLSELELELATAQAELGEFTRHYAQQVGCRLAELDRIEAHIARLLSEQAPSDAPARQRAESAQAKAERSTEEQDRFTRFDTMEKAFSPSADLKRLFRQLAQKIHPDRAADEAERSWRTELMSEANRAYRNSDEMALRGIMAQWQDGAAARSEPRISARAQAIARLQRRLAEVEGELNALLASHLYELFIAAKLARARQRDLLAEMAAQLAARISASQERCAQLQTR